MDKEEKKYVIIGFALTITLAVIFGISPILEYYNVPPPNPIPALTVLLYISIISLCIFTVIKSYTPCNKRFTNNLNTHYRKKLLKEIRCELEKEVTTKNITLDAQEKDEVLQLLTSRVTSDIMKGQTQAYEVEKALGNPDCLKLAGLILTVTQESEEVIARKMTALGNNPKYKKRTYRYSSLFN